MSFTRLLLITVASLTSIIATAGDTDFNAGTIFTGNVASLIEEIAGDKPYLSFEVDFDGDSQNELVIGIFCGNAGCENFIFRKMGDARYEYVTRVFFHKKAFQLIRNPQSDLSDIYLYSRSNAGTGCLILLKYENEKYHEVSKECGSSDLFQEIKTEIIVDVEL